jgi:hypothetical protein
MEIKETEIFICECHSLEHQLRFFYTKEELENNHVIEEMNVQMHLITYDSFFTRLWVGLKYAFGYKSRYGEWDDFYFKPKDINKLKTFLNELELKDGKD